MRRPWGGAGRPRRHRRAAAGEAFGIRFRADAEDHLLTLEIGPPAAVVAWRPVGEVAWLGHDAEGEVCAVTSFGSTGAEALLTLIHTVDDHAPQLRASIDRLLGG